MYAVVGHSAERHVCFLQIERAKELQVLLGFDNHDVQPVLARLCVLCMCARTKTDKRYVARTKTDKAIRGPHENRQAITCRLRSLSRLYVLCTHAEKLKLPHRYRMDKQLASRTSYQRTKCSVQ